MGVFFSKSFLCICDLASCSVADRLAVERLSDAILGCAEAQNEETLVSAEASAEATFFPQSASKDKHTHTHIRIQTYQQTYLNKTHTYLKIQHTHKTNVSFNNIQDMSHLRNSAVYGHTSVPCVSLFRACCMSTIWLDFLINICFDRLGSPKQSDTQPAATKQQCKQH